ncbi:hypothetical protein D9613_010940 [Agrocybe pediades]|uniref:Uncharacterized protein n=1 Tax=Agrocybe pediades TaxID=84607 RepID=A0A8H4VM77_9AGAR|nr:hypothetical protein D9613_010940 [Agrocybe pediades]
MFFSAVTMRPRARCHPSFRRVVLARTSIEPWPSRTIAAAAMSTEPPAKRQRTEDASDTASKQDESPQKSYLWFEDGNVVLQAEKTLFRRCGSHLFIVKHIREPEILGGHRKHNPGREIEGTRAAALYRLGNKYGIDYLRDEMLLRLKIFFPSTLQDYQLLREYEKVAATLPPAFRDLLLDRKFIIHPFGTLTVQDMMALANLAYQYKIMIVLPAVYARFAHLSNVWIAFNTSLLEFKDLKDPLNPEFLNTCFVGKERIASAIQKAVSLQPITTMRQATKVYCNSVRHTMANR